MKRITQFVKSIILLTIVITVDIFAQTAPFVLDAPFGYGRNATGGAGGQVITVTTRQELDAALNTSGRVIILVSGTLNFGDNQMIRRVVTDKSIIGLPGARLVSDAQTATGGILQLSGGSNNVIIRNLIFEGPGAYDVDGRDLLFNRGTNVWVDHCEFYDGVDGNFDNSNEADNVTITWNKFGYNKPPRAGGSGGSNDHRFSNLISGGESTAPADGHYSITMAYNWWGNGVRERMPRARNAQLHLLNNYVNSDVGNLAIGLSAGNNGTDVYVENCHFKQVRNVLNAGYGGSPRVTIVGSDRGNGNTNGGTSRPTYDYIAIPWQDVEAAVTGPCGAGATLDVNAATGAVSCGETAPPPEYVWCVLDDQCSEVIKGTCAGSEVATCPPPPEYEWCVLDNQCTEVIKGTCAGAAVETCPAPPPERVFIGGGEFIDSLFLFDSENNAAAWSVENNFDAGAEVFGDRAFTAAVVPNALVGAEWVQTSMNSKGFTGDTLAIFTMRKAGIVFILHEDRSLPFPQWLNDFGFAAIDDAIMSVAESETNIRSYTIYAKEFDAGDTVVLGPNTTTGFNTCHMYFFAIAEEEIVLNVRNRQSARVNNFFNISQSSRGVFNVNYTMNSAGNVRIELFDIRGRRMRTILNASRNIGNHQESFTIRNLPAATYIVRMKTGDNVLYDRVLLR